MIVESTGTDFTGITTPLLLGTDGRKMSKTYGNHVALNAPAKDVFGKVMSIPDETMASWYSLGTPLGDGEIQALLAYSVIKQWNTILKDKTVIAEQYMKICTDRGIKYISQNNFCKYKGGPKF